MSKFEWKDLPDWQGDYPAVKDVTPEIQAWELLRRYPPYIRCWQKFNRWELKDAWAYRPKKLDMERNDSWLKRCWMDGLTPTYQPIEGYLARKWGLQQLLNPSLPYHPIGGFKHVHDDYPRQLFTREHLLDMLADDESELSDLRVKDGLSVVVFNMCQPVNEQLQQAGRMLFAWQEKMADAGRVIVEERRGSKPHTWSQHLRVLDARRAPHPVAYADIGRFLGVQPSQDPHKRGKQAVIAAKKAMVNYRRCLYTP